MDTASCSARREAVFHARLGGSIRRGTRQREWNLVTDQTPEINYNQPGDTDLPNDQTGAARLRDQRDRRG